MLIRGNNGEIRRHSVLNYFDTLIQKLFSINKDLFKGKTVLFCWWPVGIMAKTCTGGRLPSLTLPFCLKCISQNASYSVVSLPRNIIFTYIAASVMPQRDFFTINPAVYTSTVAYFYFRNILTLSIFKLWLMDWFRH